MEDWERELQAAEERRRAGVDPFADGGRPDRRRDASHAEPRPACGRRRRGLPRVPPRCRAPGHRGVLGADGGGGSGRRRRPSSSRFEANDGAPSGSMASDDGDGRRQRRLVLRGRPTVRARSPIRCAGRVRVHGLDPRSRPDLRSRSRVTLGRWSGRSTPVATAAASRRCSNRWTSFRGLPCPQNLVGTCSSSPPIGRRGIGPSTSRSRIAAEATSEPDVSSLPTPTASSTMVPPM